VSDNPDDFHFAIIPDRGGGERPGVFLQAVVKTALLRPAFVMSVGDLIEGYDADAAELDRQWNELDALLQPLDMPFFRVAGNHDLEHPPQAAKWRERFGCSYYSFTYRGVLFLCLDTQAAGAPGLGDQQIAYFAEVLKRNPHPRWTFVFMHWPLWRRDDLAGFERIEALLGDRPYTVFAGHAHEYQLWRRRGRQYVQLATAGGASNLTGVKEGRFDHVTWVTMTAAGPRIANLTLDGILPVDVRTAEQIPKADK
jgi:hypothetical protein